jgi:hypothetical protein
MKRRPGGSWDAVFAYKPVRTGILQELCVAGLIAEIPLSFLQ